VSAGSAAAIERLRARAASVPDRIRALGDAPPALPTGGIRRVVTTGVGSSGSHARALAHGLAQLGQAASFLSASAFPDEHARGHDQDLLVVFSQGLSPNARLAAAALDAWRDVVVVTSTAPGEDERGRFAARLAAGGATLVDAGAGDEFGTLVRLAGPAVAHWTVWQILRAFGAGTGPTADAVADRLEATARAAREAAAPLARRLATEPVLCLASGMLVPALDNLRLKWSEALLEPAPPVTDLLDFAHGPYQTVHDCGATLLALVSRHDTAARDRLERIERLLVAGRHRLVPIHTSLADPLAPLEAEVAMNEFVLAAMASQQRDPEAWPGRDADGALYALGAATPVAPRVARGQRLDAARWPEIERALAQGRHTALLPLGSTEQHGPHLPFATDTWIADALGRRLLARMPDAVLLPTIPLGAASEHLDFPGTLSLQEDTLSRVIADVARSLARHGFTRILCYSAHGGNLRTLREADAAIVRAAAPAHWSAFTDHARLFERVMARATDVRPAEAGQHAGELETSILDAIRPGSVQRGALAPGFMADAPSGSALFYPSLRTHAPEGVVGDPRGASRERAEAYLDAWVEVLLRAFTTQP